MSARILSQKPQIGIIIQARTGSTRFPKKIIQKLPYNSDLAVIDQVILRCKKVEGAKVILATTDLPEDDLLTSFSVKYNILVYRGSKDDVLDRYYNAAKKAKLDVVIRVTSDCPFIDYILIQEMINEFLSNSLDYLSNGLVRTFPHGLDCEIFSFNSLEKAFLEAKKNEYREHVTPYLYKSNKFNIANFKAPKEINYPDIRITLDTIEDYVLLCFIADSFSKNLVDITTKDIVQLFSSKPWIKLFNSKIVQKKVEFSSLNDEILEAIKILDLQNLKNAKKILEDFLRN